MLLTRVTGGATAGHHPCRADWVWGTMRTVHSKKIRRVRRASCTRTATCAGRDGLSPCVGARLAQSPRGSGFLMPWNAPQVGSCASPSPTVRSTSPHLLNIPASAQHPRICSTSPHLLNIPASAHRPVSRGGGRLSTATGRVGRLPPASSRSDSGLTALHQPKPYVGTASRLVLARLAQEEPPVQARSRPGQLARLLLAVLAEDGRIGEYHSPRASQRGIGCLIRPVGVLGVRRSACLASGRRAATGSRAASGVTRREWRDAHRANVHTPRTHQTRPPN